MATPTNLNVDGLNFEQIKENLKAFLKTRDQFLDVNFDASGIQTLLDVLAYNTYYNATYLNLASNESFLATAQRRNSVVNLARTLNYTPRSTSSATITGTLTANIPSAGGPTFVIPRYTRFDGTVDGESFIFMNENPITVGLISGTTYSASDVTLTQGRNVYERYTVNLADKNQRFLISNPTADTKTLIVRVVNSSTDSTTRFFEPPDNVVELESTSLVYFLEEVEDGKFEVFFGDGVIGKALDSGNIVYLEYLVSAGSAGNGILNLSYVGAVAGVTSMTFTATASSVGGDERESISRIKFNAPKSYSSQNRVVTAEDYLALILKQPNVAAASVWGGEDNDPPAYGKVFIAVKPTVGAFLTPTEKENLITTVINKKKVLTVTTEIVDPEYLYLLISVTAKYDPAITSLANSTLVSLINTTVQNFNDNEIDNFSKYFRYSVLSRLVDMTERSILNNDIVVRMRKEIDIQLGVGTRYEINFANPINDTTSGRPATNPYGVQNKVTSNSFTYAGYANCFLEENNGIMRIYRMTGTENIGVVSNAGTLNYETGKIILTNFAPTAFADGGNTLKLTAYPKEKDILPLRNQIIQIRDSDITVSLVDDKTISLVNR